VDLKKNKEPMFEKIKDWLKTVMAYTPPKEVKDMTDQECMSEYKKFWDMYFVFNLTMCSRDKYRMSLLEDVLEARGYVIYSSSIGVSFEKIKK
jgi:hypothetical protein